MIVQPNLWRNYQRIKQQLTLTQKEINILEEKIADSDLTLKEKKVLKQLYVTRKQLQRKSYAILDHILAQLLNEPVKKENSSTKKWVLNPVSLVPFWEKDNKGYIGRSAQSNKKLYDQTKKKKGFYLHSVTPGGGLIQSSILTAFSKKLALTFSQYYKRYGLRTGCIVWAAIEKVSVASKMGSFYFQEKRCSDTSILPYYYIRCDRTKEKKYNLVIVENPTMDSYYQVSTEDPDVILFKLELKDTVNTKPLKAPIKNTDVLQSAISPYYILNNISYWKAHDNSTSAEKKI